MKCCSDVLTNDTLQQCSILYFEASFNIACQTV